jgi:type III secretory pathway component EscV
MDVALQQIENRRTNEISATDSQANCICMVNKPNASTQNLQGIIKMLHKTAKADNHTTFMNVKSHIGIQETKWKISWLERQ